RATGCENDHDCERDEAAHERRVYTARRNPTPVIAPQKSTSCGVSFTTRETTMPIRNASTSDDRGRRVATHATTPRKIPETTARPQAPVAPRQDTCQRCRRS